MGRSEQIACEADQIFEPHRLESELGAELAEFSGDGVVEEVVAGHYGHWSPALFVFGTKTTQEAETIDERHAEVENDGVGVVFFGQAQSAFGIDGRPDLVPFQAQHACKGLRDALIVVHDKDF